MLEVMHLILLSPRFLCSTVALRLTIFCFSIVLISSCRQNPDLNKHKAGPKIQVLRQEEGYLFQENSRPVLFYQLTTKSLDGKYERSNYVHPLYGLDGEIMTQDFPDDHLHHRGFFWAWHRVFVGEVRAGNSWLGKSFIWELQESNVIETKDGVRARFHWKSPEFQGGEDVIVEETTVIRVHESEEDFQKIDFEIRLVPQQDQVYLGGSASKKGYGGFSARLNMMVEDLTFIAAGGPVTASRTPIDAGSWMDFSAAFGEFDKKSGLAILVHPSTVGYPQPWILRSSSMKSMQNSVWPGPDMVLLPKHVEIFLRYRVVLHRGNAEKVPLEDLWNEYKGFNYDSM